MAKKEEKKPAAPAAPAGEEGAAPKSKKKLILIVVALVLLMAGGGGAAWFFLMKGKPHDEKKAPEPPPVPTFVPLDKFTVNLQREEGDQVLQVGLSLKIYNPELAEKIKTVMPEIRSSLLMLFSSKRASELATVRGKKQLSAEIVYVVNNALGLKRTPPPPLPIVPAPVAVAPATAPLPPGTAPAAAPGGLASALSQAGTPPPPAQPAAAPVAPTPVTAMVPDESETVDKEGVSGVLFTDFIIQ